MYFTWSARSRGLAEGLIEHEESIGPHGIPWADALDPDNDGWFEVEERDDYAQAALDEWHKERQGKDPKPGVRITVVHDTAGKSAARTLDGAADEVRADQHGTDEDD